MSRILSGSTVTVASGIVLIAILACSTVCGSRSNQGHARRRRDILARNVQSMAGLQTYEVALIFVKSSSLYSGHTIIFQNATL
ncbi:hypothetical protein EV421DRAFT_1799370 [Armillaria borealis]|uniref:Uncharacterized protein n=1 Tax=Armillaria borealis TaxID=47425 RepID=A0AA39JNU8_9AGAR|nr:hypothetical protein EV421DRAFT_1799370 [Armillaria borealis]